MHVTTWFGLTWGAWSLSWGLASFWSARTVASSKSPGAYGTRAGLGLGAMLVLLGGIRPWPRSAPFWTVDDTAVTVLAIALVSGFALCWWARLHLGALWSSSIVRKEGHRVGDTGPYALVRHPIYAGLIVAATATALAIATPLSFAGAALFSLSIWRRAALEEAFLRQELGPAYDDYPRRVPMLVPFIPPGRGRS
jgi:protein-S-isoprenylcysteine O-methyltransferase Ste14